MRATACGGLADSTSRPSLTKYTLSWNGGDVGSRCSHNRPGSWLQEPTSWRRQPKPMHPQDITLRPEVLLPYTVQQGEYGSWVSLPTNTHPSNFPVDNQNSSLKINLCNDQWLVTVQFWTTFTNARLSRAVVLQGGHPEWVGPCWSPFHGYDGWYFL